MNIRFFGSLLIAFACVSVQAETVNFSTFITGPDITAAVGQNNVIGITYAGNKFVGSLYLGADNDQLYQSSLDGSTVTAFGMVPNSFQGEVVLAASLGQGGFNSGDIYSGAGSQIYHFANAGGAPTLFATLPDAATVRGILFDPGSSFGGQMIVTDTSGNIYTIGPTGTPNLLASVHEDAEGMDIATSAWGSYAGDLLVASENSGDLRFITPTGSIAYTCNACVNEAEVVSFVPTVIDTSNPVEGYYEANYDQNIQFASSSQFTTLAGDVIVSSEDSTDSPITAFSYSGDSSNPFSLPSTVGHLPDQAEDGIFVTQQRVGDITPEPSSVLLFAASVGALGFFMLRRRTQA